MKKKVAVIGATGIAGQQFLAALPRHPDFEVTVLAASARSAGKSYLDALREPSGAIGWWCDEALDETYAKMTVVAADTFDATSVDIVFTAVESDAAKELEPKYALTTPVISTASAFRYFNDTPIIIPGVNNEHAALLKRQQKERGWKGFVTPIPNCTTTGLAMTLKPIYDAFGVRAVVMTSMQAMSGAGATWWSVGVGCGRKRDSIYFWRRRKGAKGNAEDSGRDAGWRHLERGVSRFRNLHPRWRLRWAY